MRQLLGGLRVDASNKFVPKSARAQWLSDLVRAIDEAQWLAWRIGAVEGRNAQALELYVELELVRAEVEAMQRPLNALRHLASAGEWLAK